MLIGTAVKVSATSNIAADSATVTIKDPTGTLVATDASMTQDSSTEYSYIYQSSSSDEVGTYTAVASIVKGSNTGKAKIDFELEEDCI